MIRAARADDLPAIAALHTVSWRDAYAGLMPAAELGDEGVRAAHLTVLAGNARARRLYARLGGREGLEHTADIHGQRLRVVRIDWPDLALLARRAAMG